VTAVVDEWYFLTMAVVDEQYFLTTAVIDEWYFLTMAVVIKQYFLMTAVVDEWYFIPKGTTTNTTTTEAMYLNRNITGCFVFPGCQNHPQSKFFLHQANICKALLNSLYTCKTSIKDSVLALQSLFKAVRVIQYINNKISNTKYTLLTFIPKNLWYPIVFLTFVTGIKWVAIVSDVNPL
jgi:hypothetical protein